MEVLREVFGDILWQGRKGFGVQGVQRRPFKTRVPKKSQLSLDDARRRGTALRWKQMADSSTKGVFGCLLQRAWLASKSQAACSQAVCMQEGCVWLPASYQPG